MLSLFLRDWHNHKLHEWCPSPSCSTFRMEGPQDALYARRRVTCFFGQRATSTLGICRAFSFTIPTCAPTAPPPPTAARNTHAYIYYTSPRVFEKSRIGSHRNVIRALSVSLERLVIVLEKAHSDLWDFVTDGHREDSVSNPEMMR